MTFVVFAVFRGARGAPPRPNPPTGPTRVVAPPREASMTQPDPPFTIVPHAGPLPRSPRRIESTGMPLTHRRFTVAGA
jgi:hypothetical protein